MFVTCWPDLSFTSKWDARWEVGARGEEEASANCLPD